MIKNSSVEAYDGKTLVLLLNIVQPKEIIFVVRMSEEGNSFSTSARILFSLSFDSELAFFFESVAFLQIYFLARA